MLNTITSHELAMKLLESPDLPIILVVNGHDYSSYSGRISHGEIKLAQKVLRYGKGVSVNHLVIGHMLDREDGMSNIESIKLVDKYG